MVRGCGHCGDGRAAAEEAAFVWGGERRDDARLSTASAHSSHSALVFSLVLALISFLHPLIAHHKHPHRASSLITGRPLHPPPHHYIHPHEAPNDIHLTIIAITQRHQARMYHCPHCIGRASCLLGHNSFWCFISLRFAHSTCHALDLASLYIPRARWRANDIPASLNGYQGHDLYILYSYLYLLPRCEIAFCSGSMSPYFQFITSVSIFNSILFWLRFCVCCDSMKAAIVM